MIKILLLLGEKWRDLESGKNVSVFLIISLTLGEGVFPTPPPYFTLLNGWGGGGYIL